MHSPPIAPGARFENQIVLRQIRFSRQRWLCECQICGGRAQYFTYQLHAATGLGKCHRNQYHGRGIFAGWTEAAYLRTYNSWNSMRSRCNRETDTSYAWYGGRGIRVWDRWQGKNGFARFAKDMGQRPEGTTLDRKNAFGNYEPGNCRWATAEVQAKNKRCNYTAEEYERLEREAREAFGGPLSDPGGF